MTDIHRRIVIFVFMFVAVSLLAATPLFITTGIQLTRLGPPPMFLDDLGRMAMTEWPWVFWSALFNFDPPSSLDALIEGYWWPIEKALLVTGAAVFVMTTFFIFLTKMPLSVKMGGGIIMAWIGFLVTMEAYEKTMGYPHASTSPPMWDMIVYGIGVVGLALFRAILANRHVSATAAGHATPDPTTPDSA